MRFCLCLGSVRGGAARREAMRRGTMRWRRAAVRCEVGRRGASGLQPRAITGLR